jgi:hypothetical protein
VLEFSHSRYRGDEAAVLGIDYLGTVGLGVELDSSKYPAFVTRARLMFRYTFSTYVSGPSIGMAVSF